MTPRRRRSSWPGRLALLLIATAIALAAVAVGASAETSKGERTFGSDGISTQTLGEHLERVEISSVSARPDGGLLAQVGIDLKSFLPDGAPDPASPTAESETQRMPVPIAGGKSLVLDGNELTRFDADGSVDTGFGEDGSVKAPPDAKVVAELASGDLVTFGSEVSGANHPIQTGHITVLNADGSTVPGGPFECELGESSASFPVREIIPTPEGGLLIVATGFLLELRADGSPNPGFGKQGVAARFPSLAGARLLPDGTIEAVSASLLRSQRRAVPAILRLTSSGARDRSLGADGLEPLPVEGGWSVNAVTWGADGSAVIGGVVRSARCEGKVCEETPAAVAVDPAGNLEPGFGDGGVLRLSSLAGRGRRYGSEGVTALTRRPDGSIVAAGNAVPLGTVGFLAALTATGAPVESFGREGIVRLGRPTIADESLSGLAPLSDGGVLAAGRTDVGVESRAMVLRYRADGALDRSFGGHAGWEAVDENGTEARGIAIRGKDALVATDRYGGRGWLRMIDAADGSPVRSFGSGGSLKLRRIARAITFASDGDPVVLEGGAGREEIDPIWVQRLRPDGSPDRAIGGGRVALRLPGGGLHARAIVAGGDGRILVAGYSRERLAVACLLPDGRLDPRFGNGGWSLISAGASLGSAALVRRGSRLYVAGVTGGSGNHRLVLARLDLRGRIDRSFGNRGIRTAPVEIGGSPTAIVPTRAGVIVVLPAGRRPVITFGSRGAVRRRGVAKGIGRVSMVQATASGGQLILGWSRYGRALESGYSLSELPLEP